MRTILLYLILIGSIISAFIMGLMSYPTLYPVLSGLGLTPIVQPVAAVGSADPTDMTVFWEVWHLLDRDFYGEKPALVKRSYGAIYGLVNSFEDPYTRFEEPVQTSISGDNFRGSYAGIGATIEETEDAFLLHPMPNQPADVAGIQSGDRLTQVDETPITKELTVDEVVALVRGETDSEVTIIVQRASVGGASNRPDANRSGSPTEVVETLTFVITRVEIQTPSMEWRLLDEDASTAKIGYVQHTQFTDKSPDELRTALAELQIGGAERYILDLRGNPGGPVEAALEMADLWLSEGVLLIEEHANGTEDIFEATAGTLVDDAPLVVLVDAASASASEILAGALQDHGRATLVGEQTYGKGSVQLRYELADQSSLFVTSANWFTPDHHQISGTGLTPNIIVEQGTDAFAVAIASVQKIAKAN